MKEQNESSEAVLEGLREIGEDVSEAEDIVKERSAQLEMLSNKIEELRNRLQNKG